MIVSLNKTNYPPSDMLVKFFTPNCPYCQALHPIFEELSNTSEFQVGEVNCKEQQQICGDEDIPHYPLIKYFSGNFSFTFSGNRSIENLTKFVTEVTQPNQFTDSDEKCHVEASQNQIDQYFVYKTATLDDKDYLRRFRTLTKICFIKSEFDELAAFRDGQTIIFEGDLKNRSEILIFTVKNKQSFLKELTAANFAKMTQNKLIVLILPEDKMELKRKLAFSLQKIDDRYFQIAWMAAKEREKFLKQYGIKGDKPTFLALDPEREDMYWKLEVKGEVVKECQNLIDKVDQGEEGEEKDEL